MNTKSRAEAGGGGREDGDEVNEALDDSQVEQDENLTDIKGLPNDHKIENWSTNIVMNLQMEWPPVLFKILLCVKKAINW